MTNLSNRGSEKPSGSRRFVCAEESWDPIHGLHQGQLPQAPLQQAGHMAAPDRAAASPIFRSHRKGRCSSLRQYRKQPLLLLAICS